MPGSSKFVYCPTFPILSSDVLPNLAPLTVLQNRYLANVCEAHLTQKQAVHCLALTKNVANT